MHKHHHRQWAEPITSPAGKFHGLENRCNNAQRRSVTRENGAVDNYIVIPGTWSIVLKWEQWSNWIMRWTQLTSMQCVRDLSRVVDCKVLLYGHFVTKAQVILMTGQQIPLWLVAGQILQQFYIEFVEFNIKAVYHIRQVHINLSHIFIKYMFYKTIW